VDVIVWWTLRNLGLGNLALIRAADARAQVANFRRVEVLNRVREEVAAAHARTHARYVQIEVDERAVQVSTRAYQQDYVRTKNREGLPIEVLDSLRLLSRSRFEYLAAILDYNRAQFELYVALGQPPARCLARPVPATLVPPPEPAPPPH
jgi:outer membrane protein TolC